MGKKECGKKCQLNILPLGSLNQHPYTMRLHDQFVEENGFVTFFLMYKLLPALLNGARTKLRICAF
jgi:hypothetical protein